MTETRKIGKDGRVLIVRRPGGDKTTVTADRETVSKGYTREEVRRNWAALGV